MNKKLTTKGSKFYFILWNLKNLKSMKIILMTQNLTTYIATFDLKKKRV